MRTVAALHSYTHTTGISFGDSGSLLVVSSFVTRADGFFLWQCCQLMLLLLQQCTLVSDVVYLGGEVYPVQLRSNKKTSSLCIRLYLYFVDVDWMVVDCC